MYYLKLNAAVMVSPLSIEHAKEMYRFVSDPLIIRNVGIRKKPSLKRTVAWIEDAMNNSTICAFAINLSGKYIGNVILDCIDRQIKSARLSIYIGDAVARGAGVGKTATYLAVSHAFREMKLVKVWLKVHCENLTAIRTYQNIGFQVEKVLSEDFILDKRVISAFYMSLLAEQFEKISIIS